MGDVDAGSDFRLAAHSTSPSPRRLRRGVETAATITASAKNQPANHADGDVRQYPDDAEHYFRMISDVTDRNDQFHLFLENDGTSAKALQFASYRNAILLSLHKMKTKNFFFSSRLFHHFFASVLASF